MLGECAEHRIKISHMTDGVLNNVQSIRVGSKFE